MKAYELLSNPDNVVRDVENVAEDKDGNVVKYLNPIACRFCILGAIWKCYAESLEQKLKVESKMYNAIDSSATFFLKTHTHEEVVSLLKNLDI